MQVYPLVHTEDGDSVTVAVSLKMPILFLFCLSQQIIIPVKENSSINRIFSVLWFAEENFQKESTEFAFWQV